MVSRLTRLDLGNAGLALLAGATLSMGFIQLLAGPLEQVATVSVQVLALQTTVLLAPLTISLLLLLRDGPLIVKLASRLARRPARWLRRLWLQQASGFILRAVALVPYVLVAALLAAITTRPELDSVTELQNLVGSLNPLTLGFSLIKTAVFAAMTLWITLQQAARAERRGLAPTAGLSRAITITMAVVLAVDLVWALTLTPLISGGAI
jgi:hypothetical protein